MESQSVESEVLRCFYGDIQEVIANPESVARWLYQEGVVAEGIVGDVNDHGLCSEKNAAIMRAVSAAIKADPKKLWVLIGVLKKFAESAPVASRMRDELHSHGLESEKINHLNKIHIMFTFNLFVIVAPQQKLEALAEGHGRQSQQGMLDHSFLKQIIKDFIEIKSM